jgi:hypothetical protein
VIRSDNGPEFVGKAMLMSRVNQGGKRDNQDGKFFEGAISEAFSSDLTALEAI